MQRLVLPSALLSLLSLGAIFGFFYAWAVSAMWGLDVADPRVAIPAMQAINAEIRNAAFAPAFFATPLLLWITAALCRRRPAPAIGFAAAGGIYLVGGLGLTMLVNVPMNEALAAVPQPATSAEARTIWQGYSGPWQAWNLARTAFSGLALVVAGWALWRLAPSAAATAPAPGASRRA